MAFHHQSFIYLPITVLIVFLGGILICYGIAANLNNIRPQPFWPFVSDTGVHPPERGIFTLVLNLGAYIGFAAMYLYFKYVLHHGLTTKCNLAALIVGAITCFGIMLVASFQWTVAFLPHIIGAFTAFIGAFVYSWIVIYISIKHMSYTGCKRGMIYCRVTIAIVETLSLVLFIVGTCFHQIKGDEYFNFASISEWFLIYSAVIFIGTLAFELHEIRRVGIKLDLHSTHTEEDVPGSITIHEQHF